MQLDRLYAGRRDDNGTSFSLAMDDVDRAQSGVAGFDPDNPGIAEYGKLVFAFDGEDAIKTLGGDCAETHFRSQKKQESEENWA
jgi:hypothetical protein